MQEDIFDLYLFGETVMLIAYLFRDQVKIVTQNYTMYMRTAFQSKTELLHSQNEST